MKVKVFAKLNLSLNVFGRSGEFHRLDSIVCSVDIFDVVEVTMRADNQITVRGTDDIPLAQNTAFRAAVAFQQTFGVGGCDISIEKHIPFGAGVGGSSADAAAVLRCLCALNNVDVGCEKVKEICSRVGSDVSFMFFGGLARMTGKGDDLRFLPFAETYFALTTFPVAISTKAAFEKCDEIGADDCDNDLMEKYLTGGKIQSALAMCCNGLQPAVRAISSHAERYLQFCNENGLHCSMTGSGSAYFSPCTSRERAISVCNLLRENGFDAIVCKTVAHGVEVTE